MKLDTLWAPARTVAPLKMMFCSDRNTYHNMSLVTGTIVNVCDLRELDNLAEPWLVLHKRGKGYVVATFLSSAEAKSKLITVRMADKNIKFCPRPEASDLSSRAMNLFHSGVSVVGKSLTPIKWGSFESIISYLQHNVK